MTQTLHVFPGSASTCPSGTDAGSPLRSDYSADPDVLLRAAEAVAQHEQQLPAS